MPKLVPETKFAKPVESEALVVFCQGSLIIFLLPAGIDGNTLDRK